MIGSVGGYIGLCLGYSIVQIPDLVLNALIYLWRYLSSTRKKKNATLKKIDTLPVSNIPTNIVATYHLQVDKIGHKEIVQPPEDEIETLKKKIEKLSIELLDVKQTFIELTK